MVVFQVIISGHISLQRYDAMHVSEEKNIEDRVARLEKKSLPSEQAVAISRVLSQGIPNSTGQDNRVFDLLHQSIADAKNDFRSNDEKICRRLDALETKTEGLVVTDLVGQARDVGLASAALCERVASHRRDFWLALGLATPALVTMAFFLFSFVANPGMTFLEIFSQWFGLAK